MTSPTQAAPARTITTTEVFDSLADIQQEIVGVAGRIDERELADLAVQIRNADRVFVAGAGRSGLALRMAAMRLMHLGLTVHVAGDTTTPAITAGDLLLAASGSGTTAGVVKAAQTATQAGAYVAAFTTNAGSPLAELAGSVVVVPAAQKTDHGSNISKQYSGSLFEQVLLLATEAVFHTLWSATDEPADQLWLRHANLE